MTAIPKIKAILRYFCANTQRPLDKIKLMNLFYFIDFEHIKHYAVPITYDRYLNLEGGPTPFTMMKKLNNVQYFPENAILADTIKIESNGEVQSIKNFSESDKDYFSNRELGKMEKVCKRFYNASAEQIEKASKKEAPWRETKYGERIPYSLATLDPDCLVSKEEIELIASL